MSQHLPPEPSASVGSDVPPSEVPPNDVLARRRFVRGVFAAPAVMTVCSGSAYADFRSLTCLEKGQGLADPPGVDAFLTGSESPIFLRTFVYEKDGVKYVRYVDLKAIGNGTTVPGSDGQFLALNDTSGNLTGVVWPPPPPAVPGPEPTGPTSARVVVRIDGSGRVVGTGTAFNDAGALVSFTCWQSFNAFIK